MELDLLDQVQKQVVSLVGSGNSSDLQAMSHRRDVASLSLFYKGNVTVRSTHFSEQLHLDTVNSPTCRTKFYRSSFFLAR